MFSGLKHAFARRNASDLQLASTQQAVAVASDLVRDKQWHDAAKSWRSIAQSNAPDMPVGVYARLVQAERKAANPAGAESAFALATSRGYAGSVLVIEFAKALEESGRRDRALQLMANNLHTSETAEEFETYIAEFGRLASRSGEANDLAIATDALLSIANRAGTRMPSPDLSRYAAYVERLVERHSARDAWEAYWRQRRDFVYLQVCRQLLELVAPSAEVVADIGSNRAPILDYYTRPRRKFSVDIQAPYSGEGVEAVQQDFLTWEPPEPVQVGTCLQVIEHVPEPSSFCRKLLDTFEVTLISVPYREPAGLNPGHINNDIDDSVLERWFGRLPNFRYVARELSGDERIVCLYDRTTQERYNAMHREGPVAERFKHRWSSRAKLAAL